MKNTLQRALILSITALSCNLHGAARVDVNGRAEVPGGPSISFRGSSPTDTSASAPAIAGADVHTKELEAILNTITGNLEASFNKRSELDIQKLRIQFNASTPREVLTNMLVPYFKVGAAAQFKAHEKILTPIIIEKLLPLFDKKIAALKAEYVELAKRITAIMGSEELRKNATDRVSAVPRGTESVAFGISKAVEALREKSSPAHTILELVERMYGTISLIPFEKLGEVYDNALALVVYGIMEGYKPRVASAGAGAGVPA